MNKTRSKAVQLLLAASLISVSACGPTPEQIRLREGQERSKSEIRSIRESVDENTQALEVINRALDEEQSQSLKTRADLLAKIESMAAQIQALAEMLEDSNRRISGLSDQVAHVRETASRPLTTEDPSEFGMGTAGGTDAPLPPERLYQTAYADYAKGNYDLARLGFEEYLRYYPNTELSDNALYWLGECAYAQRQFDEAIRRYEEVEQRYSDGDRVADAALKKGYALLETNRIAQGVIQLQSVLEDFEGMTQARRAKEKLEELGLD